jgi:hypothetical protein
MRFLAILAILALLTAAGPVAAKKRIEPVENLGGGPVTVHEWGVFRVNEDVAVANADLRALWDDLPEFAYGHARGRVVPQHWGAVEIRKNPVIFFHAPQPAHIRLRVEFPGGMAGVWFPATVNPAVEANQPQPEPGGVLEWDLGIGQCPPNWRPKLPAPAEVPEKHWVARTRQVQASELFARFGPEIADVEREKFVYYDGIFPQGKWLKFDVAKDKVTITNRVKHPVFDVTVVDRRDDATVRVGRIAKLEAGAAVKEVKFQEFTAAAFAADASETLVKQLVAAGLNEDEAGSLLDMWRKDMFETPGVCAFYRIPQSEYDVRMPLTITPRQEKVVRVGLVYHGHLEPDFAERVLELVKKLDSPKFADRDAATKKLLAIGPAALAQLQKLHGRNDLSVEVRERVDALIKKWSALASLAP